MIMLLLSGCSGYHTKTQVITVNEPSKLAFECLRLLETEHSELDFGISDHDGQKKIRDFAITESGSLLLFARG